MHSIMQVMKEKALIIVV